MTGLADLIQFYKEFPPERPMEPSQLTYLLHEGAETDPERFPELMDSHKQMLQQHYTEWDEQKCMRMTLHHLGISAVQADYEWEWKEPEVLQNKKKETLSELYSYEKYYGPTMTLMADYVGLHGPELSGYLLAFSEHSPSCSIIH